MHPRFFESQNEAGGESTGRVVERFFIGGDVYRDATEGTRDGARDADGRGIAFNGKNLSFERRNADAIEGLHRVHRSGKRTEGTNGLQDAGVTGTAGVENDFSTELLSTDAGELGGNFGDGVIGYAHQDSSGG